MGLQEEPGLWEAGVGQKGMGNYLVLLCETLRH